jgi:hypothetical protein
VTELRIGDDDLGALPGAHHARADADPAHAPRDPARLDGVADVDRPLEEQDQSRDEVVHDTLQAEADPDAERAGHDGQLREVEPQDREACQEPQGEEDVVQQARESIGQAAGEADPRVHVLLEREAKEGGQEVRGP